MADDGNQKKKKRRVSVSVGEGFCGLVAIACLAGGGLWQHWLLGGAGATVILCFFAWRFSAPSSLLELDLSEPHCSDPLGGGLPPQDAIQENAAENQDQKGLCHEMLSQYRESLLLRPQIAQSLETEQLRKAATVFDQRMGVVPDGRVVLSPPFVEAEDKALAEQLARPVDVEAVYLDRRPVTNREFYEFVRLGGYEQMVLWDPIIWPGVFEFIDQTGNAGPRFWRDGKYLPGEENLPVVGVSWYEAAAYARWVGKRLATDAEWVKAGCWPIESETGLPTQRKYPWGDSMDRSRANLWGSGPGHPVAVTEFPNGVSVGGIYQLVGNVWEWTNSNFGFADDVLATDVAMKSLHGGAFDTYFDSQATCQFQSGDSPLARKHNIGFRCALGFCDVVVVREDGTAATIEEPVATG